MPWIITAAGLAGSVPVMGWGVGGCGYWNRPSFHRLLAAKSLERIVEDPFGGVFDGFVEGVWEERNSRKAKLDRIISTYSL